VNFILDADIRSFFTEVSQEWVVRFLEHRIGDRRIIRLVQKWLRAGVLEDGIVTVEEKGTGQGSVISPLLANVYLHYVFDLWAERWRRREATGDMTGMPTTPSWASSMRKTPGASGARCAKGSRSSRCRFIRTKPA
jgi:retron-type reverse transcriptase